MRVLPLILLAAFGLAAPAAAQGQSIVFGRYQQFCDPAVGGWQKALSLAEAEGWAELPADAMGDVGDDVSLTRGGVRVMVKDRRMFMLIAGEAKLDLGRMRSAKAGVCGVMAFTAETAVAKADIQRLLAAPPARKGFEGDESFDDLQVWAWTGTGAKRAFFDDVESAKAERAFRRGDFTALMVGEDTGVTMVMQMRAIR